MTSPQSGYFKTVPVKTGVDFAFRLQFGTLSIAGKMFKASVVDTSITPYQVIADFVITPDVATNSLLFTLPANATVLLTPNKIYSSDLLIIEDGQAIPYLDFDIPVIQGKTKHV